MTVSTSCRWALALSLLIHAGFLALLAVTPARRTLSNCAFLSLESRGGNAEVDVSVVLLESPPAPRASPMRVAETVPESNAIQASRSTSYQAPAVATSGDGTGELGQAVGEPRPGSGHGLLSFFDVPVQAKSVVYVIDRSASMGPHGALDTARRELLKSLRSAPRNTRFQIIAYNRLAEPLRIQGRMELTVVSEASIAEVELAVTGLRPEGGTEQLGALRRALLLRPDVIFFLTDAGDLRPEHIQVIANLNRGQTRIHSIELQPPGKRTISSVLERLAKTSGGTHRCVGISTNKG